MLAARRSAALSGRLRIAQQPGIMGAYWEVLFIIHLLCIQVGMANFFLLHTSASLTINENASPDVPLDLNDALDKIAPEGISGSNLHMFKFRD